jgi:hypothetical protein
LQLARLLAAVAELGSLGIAAMHAKMPETAAFFWVGFAIVALVLIGLCWVSPRFYWASVPASLFVLYQGWSQLYANVSFRNAMIRELGYSYFLQFTCSYALLIAALALYALYDYRRRKPPAA